jgi:hypothetical protein
MLKVDSIFRVFNAGRLSKEDMRSNLSSLSFENTVMNGGRILIPSQDRTQNSSRRTIDWKASGSDINLEMSQMCNDFNFTSFETKYNSWSHCSTVAQGCPDIWSLVRVVNLPISTANAWPRCHHDLPIVA